MAFDGFILGKLLPLFFNLAFHLFSDLDFRHQCKQEENIIYGYDFHDGRNVAQEKIQDDELNLRLSIDFIIPPQQSYSSTSPWYLKINKEMDDKDELQKSLVSIVYYFALDGDGYFKLKTIPKTVS